MFSIVTNALARICLLVSLWPTLRLGGFTIFDELAPITLAITLVLMPRERLAKDRDFSLLVGSQVLFLIGAILSTSQSASPSEHISKSFAIVTAMAVMIALINVWRRAKVVSLIEGMTWLMFSATASSFVAILQGRYGILTALSPSYNDVGFEDYLRPTGLAEHPIEASGIAALGVVIAVGFILRKDSKPWHLFIGSILSIVTCGFALLYTASLTALLSLIAAISVQLALSKRYAWSTVIATACMAIFLSGALFDANTLLGERVDRFLRVGLHYNTVESRSNQLAYVISKIHFQTLIVGNGYADFDLPLGKDIHNGVLASLYHFGGFGLLSQIFLFIYLGKKVLVHRRGNGYLLLSVVILFLGEYLTGPVFARRSNFIGMLFIAAYLPAMPNVLRRFPRRSSRPLKKSLASRGEI